MANTLGYSKLTYNDIVNQINERMKADPRFQTTRDSASTKMIIDQFAGMTDMISYYLERRAEESYLETCKLRSSVIELSKQLGYVVQRPIPANASMSITIRGDELVWSSVEAGDSIQIPTHSQFSYGGNTFLLKHTYIYTFTVEDINNLRESSDYFKTIQYGLYNNEDNYNLYNSADLVDESDLITMDVVQGEIKYHFVAGMDNPQVEKIFQIYNIPDTTFSNIYGSSDYDKSLTKVATSDASYNIFDPANNFGDTSVSEYQIDRRSIMQTDQPITITDPKRICLLRTNSDETVDLVFGDGVYAKKGAEASENNISIQYLSTIGSKANQVGALGSIVTFDGEIKTVKGSMGASTSTDVKAQIEFNFTTNIFGGADMEEVASIKLNAPAIYYSLDRCVTTEDYVAYLNTLTTPIIVKNAQAWGEQEEGGGAVIPKLFNIALFSCFGEMYRYNSVRKEWSAKDSDTGEGGDMADAVLDKIDIFGGGTKEGEVIADNHYFYMVVNENSPGAQRDSQLAETPTSKLGIVYNNLKTRSQMTVRNVYITPIIQEFDIQGKIYINTLSDATEIETKIKNDIYSYLNNSINYNVPVRLSDIIELIETQRGVLYSNVALTPSTDIGDRDVIGVSGETVSAAVARDSSVDQWIRTAVTITPVIANLSATIATIISGVWHQHLPTSGTELDFWKTKTDMLRKINVTESWFWKTFVKQCYDSLANVFYSVKVEGVSVDYYFRGTKYFDQLMMKFKNMFAYSILYNTMVITDTDIINYGQLTTDIFNYTLRVELPKVTFKAGVMYK